MKTGLERVKMNLSISIESKLLNDFVNTMYKKKL